MIKTFVLISDTHGLHDRVKVPPVGDVLIHAGDCTNDPGQAALRGFLVWLERQPQPHKILIAGNHDWAFEKWPDLAQQMVKEYAPSVTYLQDSGCEIDGIKFWGSPVSPRFFDWAFNRDRGADIKRHWDMIPADTDVIITHGPVKGIHDFSAYGKEYVGCDDLLNAVCRINPVLHVCGHVHGGHGHKVEYGSINFVNASSCDERYHPVNPPIVFTYEKN